MLNLVVEQENLEILGERLREVRTLRNMTPLRLAAEMESSLTSIRDWENGERKLQPATIRRLANALELSYPEELYWLGLAGHLPKTRMPSKHQIVDSLEAYYTDLAKLPFPAQIIDHNFTYWCVNPATIDFLGSRELLVNIMKHKLTILDVIFNSQIGFFKRVSQSQQRISRQQQLARRMVGRSIHRRHERFYQDYPAWLKQRMSAEDFDQFLTVWNEANSIEQNERPHFEDDIMLRYFEFEYPDGSTRKLQMRTDHLRHFGDIFEIIVFYPHEPEDEESFKPVAQEGVKLWEITDVGKLLKTYK
ncbi:MAG: helix-turn-helix transcriptional regulator [Anaerolineae bacterium]|nr:helix-turn-helix transcriptional regulator [Anaerolineae bacterium]